MLLNCFQFKHYQSKMSLDENENALKLDLSIVQSTMSRATETAQVMLVKGGHETEKTKFRKSFKIKIAKW